MIFPSESLFQLRRSLTIKVATGELTDEQGFREALRADPDDYGPLSYLGVQAEESGDLSEAERYARELIRVHPSGHEGYLLLSRILTAANSDSTLARGYGALGLSKLLFDEDAIDDLDSGTVEQLCRSNTAIGDLSRAQVIAAMVEVLKRERSQEPTEV